MESERRVYAAEASLGSRLPPRVRDGVPGAVSRCAQISGTALNAVRNDVIVPPSNILEPGETMPLLRLETTVNVPADRKAALLGALSKAVAETVGKPERYVMVSVSRAEMLMSGSAGDAVFGEVRSIGGLNPTVNRALSEKVSRIVHEFLGVKPDRVYLNFSDVKPDDWGWNGGTFG
jgi:phenylpyruvate tautomerase